MLEVDRDRLFDCVNILNLVAPQSGVIASDFFLLERDSVLRVPVKSRLKMSSAGVGAATVRLQGEGEWPYKEPFYVTRDSFSKFIGLESKQTKVTFEKLDQLVVRYGREVLKLSSLPQTTGFSRLGNTGEMNVLDFSPEMIELLVCASTCAASEESLPLYSSVYLVPTKSGFQFLSSNQKIVFLGSVRGDTELVTDRMPIPVGLMTAIAANGMKRLKWGKKCVIAKFRSGIVWHMTSEMALKEYPVESVRETVIQGRKPSFHAFNVSAYKFSRLVKRIETVIQSEKKSDWVLTLTGKQDQETVSMVANQESYSMKEILKTKVPNAKDFKIEWPLDWVSPVLAYLGRDNEPRVLSVGITENRQTSYLRCENVEMAVPGKVA